MIAAPAPAERRLGMAGRLRLELCPVAGRTRLLRAEQRVPLHVGRALHREPGWPELAHVTINTPTGGFAQGDRLDVDVLARPGSAAHLTSQSASRAYRCERGDIHQELRLDVRGNGYLEWWPDPLIPYAGTRWRQDATLVVDPEATLLFADAFLAGRRARGEHHAYDALDSATVALRPDGATLFRDTLRLRPAERPPGALGLLADAGAWATIYLLGPNLAASFEHPLAEALDPLAPTAGATRLPGEAGLLVRALTATWDDLRAVQDVILATARQVLRGHRVSPSAKL